MREFGDLFAFGTEIAPRAPGSTTATRRPRVSPERAALENGQIVVGAEVLYDFNEFGGD